MGEAKLPEKKCNPNFRSWKVEIGKATVLVAESGKQNPPVGEQLEIYFSFTLSTSHNETISSQILAGDKLITWVRIVGGFECVCVQSMIKCLVLF